MSAGSAKLPYGLNTDDRLVHVSEVASGSDCGCVCPTCRSPLVARKGRERVHHFAHNSAVCSDPTGETLLHRLAKKVLETNASLTLPEVSAFIGKTRRVMTNAKTLSYTDPRTEVPYEGLVADGVVTVSGRPLLVEFHVTHPSDEEKCARLKALDLATVEIDLSQFVLSMFHEDNVRAILHDAPRHWLWNRRRHQWVTEQTSLYEQDLKRQEEESITRYLKFLPKVQKSADASLADVLRCAGVEQFVGLDEFHSPAFYLDAVGWQSVVMCILLEHRGRHSPQISLSSILARIGKKKSPSLDNGQPLYPWLWPIQLTRPHPSHELIQAVTARRPDYRRPDSMLDEYLEHLRRSDLLREFKGQLYSAFRLDRARQKLGVSERNKSAVEDVVTSISELVEFIPEASRFNVRQWVASRLHAPGQENEDDDDLPGRAEALLACVATLFETGTENGVTPDMDLMGLPVAAEVRRRHDAHLREQEERRTRLHEYEAGQDRALVDRMRGRAAEMGGDDVLAVLEKVLNDPARTDPDSGLFLDRRSIQADVEAEWRHIKDARDDERVRQVREAREKEEHDRKVASLRGQLRELVERSSLKPEIKALYMSSPQPVIGGLRPKDITSQSEFDVLVGALKRSQR